MTTLFHISDLHFGAEDRVALDRFRGIVAAEKPDAIVLTGDITMSAQNAEFLAAAAWLKQLGVPIALGVGNHDLPMTNIVARMFSPYRRYEALAELVSGALDLPGVSIVPLRTTARFQWRLNWSKGKVSTRALEDALAAIAAVPKGHLILIACHHPLIDAGTSMDGRTRGGAAALRALVKAGVHSVLSGHVHDPFDLNHEVEGKSVRLIGAGTLSERVRDSVPSFNEIKIAGDTTDVVIRAMN